MCKNITNATSFLEFVLVLWQSLVRCAQQDGISIPDQAGYQVKLKAIVEMTSRLPLAETSFNSCIPGLH